MLENGGYDLNCVTLRNDTSYTIRMMLTISKKLTLAFVVLTIIILIATLGLARWSFERGFLDYINTIEKIRLETLAESLAKEYANADKTWSTLNEEMFGRLLHHTRSKLNPPPPPGHRPPASKRNKAHPRRTKPPTALYNAKGTLIRGRDISNTKGDMISVPILLDSVRIGELRSHPQRHFATPAEAAFSQQQLVTSSLIAILSLILAIVIAWLLTRILLSPIRHMNKGVSLLSNGDYSIRLKNNGSDELGQLMRDLNHLADILEKNRTSQRRWLADISHELRTPVTVLTGEIEALKDGIRPLDMKQVVSLDQEISRLRYLVEDLYQLSLADIGGLRYTFEILDITIIIDSVVNSFLNRVQERNLKLSCTAASRVKINGDKQRLIQLFTNLLENSLAYTHAPGEIKIEILTDNQRAIIKIQDTPPGVEASKCKKLFEALYRQESSRNRHIEGAGLGMAICKSIVEAHAGEIEASPSALGGLCVTIYFPFIK